MMWGVGMRGTSTSTSTQIIDTLYRLTSVDRTLHIREYDQIDDLNAIISIANKYKYKNNNKNDINNNNSNKTDILTNECHRDIGLRNEQNQKRRMTTATAESWQ